MIAGIADTRRSDMSHALRTSALALASAALSLGAIACHKGDKSASGKGEGSQSASVPTVQYNKAPCDWITRAEVEKVFGEPLVGDPVRVRSAENAVPQPDGRGCMYEMKQTSDIVKRTVAIEMELDDAGAIQAGFSGVPDIQAVFKDKESKGDSMVDGRWDYVSGVPGGLTMAREGRITAQIFAFGESDKGMALAAAIMDKIADLPFAEDPKDLTAPHSDPDPCSLISRAGGGSGARSAQDGALSLARGNGARAREWVELLLLHGKASRARRHADVQRRRDAVQDDGGRRKSRIERARRREGA